MIEEPDDSAVRQNRALNCGSATEDLCGHLPGAAPDDFESYEVIDDASYGTEANCPNLCVNNPEVVGANLPCSDCGPDASAVPDDIDGHELAVNTREGINVDATWRAIREPITTLQEFRALAGCASVTEDIGIDQGQFAVTSENGIPVAHFSDIDDARLFLSMRHLLKLLADETHRANLAESRVAGLEGTIKGMREYDLEHPEDRDPVDKCRDVIVGFESEQLDELDPHRPISVRPMTEDYDDDDHEFYVGSREARRAAAQLWRAADEEDRARARRARGEVTSEDPA